MSKAVVDKLNGALVTAIRDPENHKALVVNGAEPIGSSPEEHAASIRSEIEKWKKVARDANIEPQ
jgi:tripartite-type tricarboxylate transporter receptor subunit TctC